MKELVEKTNPEETYGIAGVDALKAGKEKLMESSTEAVFTKMYEQQAQADRRCRRCRT